ncbi:hypothetical protein A0H81_05425 [Grifola frondosa]|uniref:Uncharacterized protein n=1 Tax=Grifola frondosa TaxID=5627 RepID=A0A1C7MCL0_GRIFR|nr:hypothetical protein A0H81_05425 [Grifola frondosa]
MVDGNYTSRLDTDWASDSTLSSLEDLDSPEPELPKPPKKKAKKQVDGGRDAISAAQKMPATASVTDLKSAVMKASTVSTAKQPKSQKPGQPEYKGKSGVKTGWVPPLVPSQPGWTSQAPPTTKMVVKPPATPHPVRNKTSKQPKKMPKMPLIVQEGGFVSESDESIEKMAAQSSPLKPVTGRRVTSNGIVKTEDKPMLVRKKAAQSAVMNPGPSKLADWQLSESDGVELVAFKKKASMSKKPSNGKKDDYALPEEAIPLWNKKAIPTIVMFVGTCCFPWSFIEWAGMEHILGLKVLCMIWVFIYGPVLPPPEPISLLCPLVTQKLSEYRFLMGNAAITGYHKHFAKVLESANTLDGRAHAAELLLKEAKFTYENADGMNRQGLFRAPMILRAFFIHLTAIENAVNIPGLYVDEYAKHPIGALSLAVTAAERALTLFKVKCITFVGEKPKYTEVYNDRTGCTSNIWNYFSEDNWGSVMQEWLIFVQRLSDAKIAAIIHKAHPVRKVINISDEEQDFNRAMMVDLDSD